MAPPAAGPLIQGSTTPIANETATAASTASPPASSTLAPTSAARRCAAATRPPRVGITALRTIWEREKLSMACAVRFEGSYQSLTASGSGKIRPQKSSSLPRRYSFVSDARVLLDVLPALRFEIVQREIGSRALILCPAARLRTQPDASTPERRLI